MKENFNIIMEWSKNKPIVKVEFITKLGVIILVVMIIMVIIIIKIIIKHFITIY